MGKLSPKRLGIMGGMGPMATVDLYRKIIESTPAQCDQGHIPIVIDNYPQIEDRTAFILGQGRDPSPKMIESANRLKQAGAQAILIACNTAHYFVPTLNAVVDVPIIHIVQSAVQALTASNQQGSNYQRIAVLATDGMVKSGLYQKALAQADFEVVPLNTAQQHTLMSCIYDGAKKGKVADFQSSFQSLIDAIEADAYIAACTEIPLFTEKLTDDCAIIDATQALAEKAVQFALYSC